MKVSEQVKESETLRKEGQSQQRRGGSGSKHYLAAGSSGVLSYSHAL